MEDRQLTVRAGEHDATMTVTKLDARLGALGLTLGQLDDVRLELADIRWSAWRARSAVVICRDVHVNPPLTLVTSPVEFELVIAREDLPRWWRRVTPYLVDGALHVRISRWLPAKVFPLPELPNGLRLTGIEVGPDEFVLSGAAPQWRERLSVSQLVELLSRLASSQSSSRSDTTSGTSSWGT